MWIFISVKNWNNVCEICIVIERKPSPSQVLVDQLDSLRRRLEQSEQTLNSFTQEPLPRDHTAVNSLATRHKVKTINSFLMQTNRYKYKLDTYGIKEFTTPQKC